MAEIHEHDIHHEHEGSSMVFLMGFILLIVALFLLFYFLSPAFRTPMQFNIPGRIDVNLRQMR